MKKCFSIVLSLIVTLIFVGFNQVSQNGDDDKKQIENIVKSYQEAFNQQDAARLTKDWMIEGIFINPVTGESAEGKEAIEKLFKEKFSKHKKRQLNITIKNIEFPTSNEAIENGIMEVSMEDQPLQKVAYQTEYVKENGKWFIKAIHEIELLQPISNFKHLKNLEWLIGKWEDKDDNIQILFENDWDKNKNFITQRFNMKILGQENIEGKQIIAWDRAKSLIRSWVFDSEGGFGEGIWEKKDKSWYVTLRYTLNDGTLGSSLNIYTPVDENSYTFSSVEREIGGEVLPDMNPVTVEKMK